MGRITKYFSARWSAEGGYREFLIMAFPLILSTGAWSVQHFINRMFLTWYSPETVAASMPAGMANFTIFSVFLGTVSYVDVFVAQYYGARRHAMIGPAVWQGIYLSAAAALVVAAFAPFSRQIFDFFGHDPLVRQHEIVYFRILCLGSFPPLAAAVMSGFYAGRGKTWTIVMVNSAGTGVNILLDYLLIFGNAGFPELGMKGAALATVASGLFTFLFYVLLITRKKYEADYHTRSGWRLSPELIRRIARFGLPAGLHFSLDTAGFTLFILIMGTLGTVNLAATSIAFNISTLAFMPMIGAGIAASVLVGQYLGKNRPEIAARSAFSGFHLAFAYMGSISLTYVFAPGLFLAPYASKADPATFGAISGLVVTLLRFVAVYSLFDAMNMIFAAAVKGAGDTHFVLQMGMAVSLFVLVIPTYLALVVLKQGIFTGWTIASCYVAALGIGFLLRFLTGKWKSMRVIETAIPAVPPSYPELPQEEM
jgi:MATE family multidrug resistance protein